MTDISHEHQAATVHDEVTPGSSRIVSVFIQLSNDLTTALIHHLFQGTLHQAKPIAVDHTLVFSVYRSN